MSAQTTVEDCPEAIRMKVGPRRASNYYRNAEAYFATANDAIFEVRVAVEPPLMRGEEHAFTVSINGRPVNRRFTATEFMIPREFWGDDAPPNNLRIQLDACIVDRHGQVLKQASPVHFVMLHSF